MGDTLTDFIEQVSGDSHLRVETDFGDGFVRLRSAEAERRQAAQDVRSSEDIIIEMLRNARDAQAKTIFIATGKEEGFRNIIMIDDGSGIPSYMHVHIFEPRVTSKLDTVHMDKWGIHGRGMALYAIATNSEIAQVSSSERGLGSSFLVKTNLKKISEKTDQSTFPHFERGEGDRLIMRGPKNILRTACEFALEDRKQCEVYLGTNSEIAATLYEFGNKKLTAPQRTFSGDLDKIPVSLRLSFAIDPAHFAHIAQSLGITLSERSARRIMDGEIKPLESLLVRLSKEAFPHKESSPEGLLQSSEDLFKTYRSKHKLKLTKSDSNFLKDKVVESFAEIAPLYYLEPNVSPELKVTKDYLTIKIPLEPSDS